MSSGWCHIALTYLTVQHCWWKYFLQIYINTPVSFKMAQELYRYALWTPLFKNVCSFSIELSLDKKDPRTHATRCVMRISVTSFGCSCLESLSIIFYSCTGVVVRAQTKTMNKDQRPWTKPKMTRVVGVSPLQSERLKVVTQDLTIARFHREARGISQGWFLKFTV